MSTRLDVVESQKSHPILTGVEKPWTECGGYWTEPMPDSTILAMGQPLVSMKKGADAQSKPCPNSWIRNYSGKNGSTGRVFNTTSGASEDIRDDGFRRMVVNACFWAVGLEKEIKSDNNVAMVGDYNPTTFQMNSGYYEGVKPLDLAGWESPIMNSELSVKVRKPKAKTTKKPTEPTPPKEKGPQ